MTQKETQISSSFLIPPATSTILNPEILNNNFETGRFEAAENLFQYLESQQDKHDDFSVGRIYASEFAGIINPPNDDVTDEIIELMNQMKSELAVYTESYKLMKHKLQRHLTSFRREHGRMPRTDELSSSDKDLFHSCKRYLREIGTKKKKLSQFCDENDIDDPTNVVAVGGSRVECNVKTVENSFPTIITTENEDTTLETQFEQLCEVFNQCKASPPPTTTTTPGTTTIPITTAATTTTVATFAATTTKGASVATIEHTVLASVKSAAKVIAVPKDRVKPRYLIESSEEETFFRDRLQHSRARRMEQMIKYRIPG